MIGGFVPVIHAAMPGRPDEQDTLDTAAAVRAALGRLGYAAEIVDIGMHFKPLARFAANPPWAVFNLVEAVGGVAGRAFLPVRLMERLGLRHTGAGGMASELTSSKTRTKRLLKGHSIPTPGWWEGEAEPPPGLPVILKPDTEHASLGIDATSVVAGRHARHEMARRQAQFATRFFAEAYVDGREFNVALIEEGGRPRMLPIPEIMFDELPEGRPRIVDYEAKWDPSSYAYHHTPRRFGIEAREPELAAELCRLARASWEAAKLSGYARVDFRVDSAGAPAVIDINTNPCLAPDAGFAATAAVAGISYDEVVGRIVNAATAMDPGAG
jgi:D-alanine-D-alanine ligase